VIHLDTSVLVDAFTGPRRSALALREVLLEGHGISFSTIVLFEWRRGARTTAELADQEALLPDADVVAFDVAAAKMAARLYAQVRRPRGREADLAVAATAIVNGATLWTLNRHDFTDIPGVQLR
jgi:predicted nucleic acid-binding protein